MSVTKVEVKGRASEPFRQTISAGKHSFHCDAPQEFGGGDTAANPHELLLGALGSCTAVTMEMYAKRKGWDLQEVKVELTHEDIADPEQAGRKIAKITRTIAVAGNLSQEEVDGLKAVAEKCPVHKIINGPNQTVTEIKRLTSV
jgi:putative redox protein